VESSMKLYTYLETPWGKIIALSQSQKLEGLFFDKKTIIDATWHQDPHNSLFIALQQQLQDYCNGLRNQFDIPYILKGTAFQQKVWKATAEIPYSHTVDYQGLAERIGSPKAARAVGAALGKNPLLLIIPCHRVIGRNGTLTGFAAGLSLKKKLLSLEQRIS
jgi:methylated-DNA-[protein]-cysteine S-methyltransferase